MLQVKVIGKSVPRRRSLHIQFQEWLEKRIRRPVIPKPNYSIVTSDGR
jgi:hypothetical protein